MALRDVLVIGGGLVGCASAFYLAKAGAAVRVVERGDLNREASGRNAGSLHFQLEHRLIEHGDAQAEQFAQIIPLNLMAIDAWSGLEAELGADLEIIMHGGLMLAETPEQVARLEKKYALEQRWGLPTELLDKDAILKRAPYLSDTVMAAGYSPQEGHASPRHVTLAYARAAAKAGVIFDTKTRVKSLKRDASCWHATIKHDDGKEELLKTQTVLNAAGAWAGQIAEMANIHLPVYPVPLLMNVTEEAPPLLDHLIQHAGRKITMKQVRDGQILIGGGWSSRFHQKNGRLDYDRAPEPIHENIIGNLAVATDLVPQLKNQHLLRSWTGIASVTTDQLPILGEVPEAPGFYVATGGSGFTLGPVYARLMSELILTGGTEAQIDLYSPRRFRHINMFMG